MLSAAKEGVSAGHRRRLGLRLSALFLCLAQWTAAGAGGSAETTLVVVNAASPLSQYVANEYLRLRGVPETHLLYLADVPSFGTLAIEDFRRKIWQPIREYLVDHHLEEEVDLIVYSADFPYGVDFGSDIKRHQLPRNRYRGRVASLTGLTYFARRVATGDLGYLGINYYFREFAGPTRRVAHPGAALPPLSRKELKRLRKQAAAALRARDYASAQDRYRQLADSQPSVAEYWYDLARAQAAAGQTEQALATLTAAVDHGWVNSLRTQRDRELAGLREQPGFRALLERMETAYGPFEITHGFRHHYVWSNDDLAAWEPTDELNRYYLSTLLAYTGVRGNSLPEIDAYLSRAVASDGTVPAGTVYLMENGDVRSDTRQPLFPAAVAELARRGRAAEILGRGDQGQNGILPMHRADVVGAVVGARRFDWRKSGSRLLPGAIAESLTSYGGHFDKASQTKLTAFLRHGAAGSSGAVAEPFSFQEKFPVPLLHAYYADGCSLAEAYFQSVQMPYQLIIVGDALARPFARFAEIDLRAPDPATAWSGSVAISATLQPAAGTAIKTVELWIDGQYLGSAPAGESLAWDTRAVEDGGHELRLVAVEDSPIETRSVYRTAISVFNHDRRIEIDPLPAEVGYGQAVEITGRAPGAERVELRRGHRVLASADLRDGQWRLSVAAGALGMGTSSVQVRAVYPGGRGVRSMPLAVKVRAPERLPAAVVPPPDGTGLTARVHDAEGGVEDLQVDRLGGRLKALETGRPQPVSIGLNGYLKAERSGLYQLALRSQGRLRLRLHDRELLDAQFSAGDAEAFVALDLEAGWHPLQIQIEPATDRPSLRVVLAGQTPPALLTASNLGHHRPAAATPLAQSAPQPGVTRF